MHQIQSTAAAYKRIPGILGIPGILAAAALVAACAQTEPVQQQQTSEPPAPAVPAKPVQPVAKAPAPTMAEEVIDYTTLNPVPLQFEKMAIKLEPDEKEIIAKLVSRAQAAPRIVITGYCDRQQIGNAKDAAIARAVAVREEFVKHGVPARKFRIKYLTEAANKHMVEIQF